MHADAGEQGRTYGHVSLAAAVPLPGVVDGQLGDGYGSKTIKNPEFSNEWELRWSSKHFKLILR